MACYVTNIFPNNLLEGQSSDITITGSGFINPVFVIINGLSITPSILTDGSMKIILPTLSPGVYNVIIKNGNGVRWITKSGFSIHSNVQTSPLVGSSSLPVVLPQRIVDSSPNATQNNNIVNAVNASLAKVTVDTTHNMATGTRNVNNSYIPNEGAVKIKTGISENSNAIIVSPWGKFINE